ncbi:MULTISPECIES: hypothetical protein [Streptomyces]|uniref:Uncharacterized protein n=1 Tax=Streptomyces koelreuteriae TaxID=2838015 RepID=A0ABX8FUY0_9ACTN|nr:MULTISPECIES: hypothetical protein [Streptomyces]QWB25010.1 hypothetical protein KJK29_21895 [Streptomyces koelreuteriae]UUA08039.1 hypothetical protein NNW98_22030 [Streptomyces koelreuteriae]UUA15646.1 hypothetical protein NNW99_21915 [Streptomyces sp. CRCS-T-1]
MDESEPDPKTAPGTYILAIALVLPAMLEPVREAMLSLRLPGQRKLHWHGESAGRRATIVDRIASLPVRHLVVVRDGLPEEPSERRRRKCLARVVWELDQRGVTRLVAESRERKQNGRDVKAVGYLRSSGMVSSALHMLHEPGPCEPVLWVADCVAGAAAAGRSGKSHQFDALRHTADVIRITAGGTG